MGMRLFRISGWEDKEVKSKKLSGNTMARVSGNKDRKESESIFGPKISGERDYSYLEPLEPHPEVFKIIDAREGYKYLYLEVLYPHCTNFEGRKIILMKDTTLIDVCLTKILDPHFYKENKIIARFRPDDEGRKLAKEMAGCL